MKRAPEWILALLTAAFFEARVAEWRGHSELVGTWIIHWPDQMHVTDVPAEMLPKVTLTLYNDGTYTEYLENHVMLAALMCSSGKYTRSGNAVALNGTYRAYGYDRCQKRTQQGPWTETLTYTGDALLMGNDPTWLAFRREGDCPRLPNAGPKPRR